MKLYMFRAVPLPETCRVSCQNKFVKLVHLVGFIIKKFVTMHGHVNAKSPYAVAETQGQSQYEYSGIDRISGASAMGINYLDDDRDENEDENIDTFPLWFNTVII